MTFGTLYNYAGELSEAGDEIWSLVAADFGPARAYSFMVFNLLCAPCFAAIGAIKREMGNAKWTWITVGYMCALAYSAALCVYQFAGLVTGEASFGVMTVVAVLVFAAMAYMLLRKGYQAEKSGKILTKV